jgi:hypothetical protein
MVSKLFTERYSLTEAELLLPSEESGDVTGLIVISTAIQVWPDRSFVPALMGRNALLMINTVRGQDVSFGNQLPPLEVGIKNFIQRMAPIGRLENFMAVTDSFHQAAGNIIHHILWAQEVLERNPLKVSLVGYGAGALPALRAAVALESTGHPPLALGLVFPPEGLKNALSPAYMDSNMLLPLFWRRLDIASNLKKIKVPALLLLAAAERGGRDAASPYADLGQSAWITLDEPMHMRRHAQTALREWLVDQRVLEGKNEH